MARSDGPVRVMLTGGETELGQVVAATLAQAGYPVVALVRPGAREPRLAEPGVRVVRGEAASAAAVAAAAADAQVVLHLSPQVTNTLLHDGRAWRGWASRAPREAQGVVVGARAVGSPLVVLASYACLYGAAQDATEETPLAPPPDQVFTAAVAAERVVRESGLPYVLLRLGFLYGPQSRDLELYVRSFQLRRPYYAGPAHTLGNWLHFEDAARALERVVALQPRNAVYNLVDGQPVNFGRAIDHFAALVGFRRVRHLPPRFRLLYRPFIWRPQQLLLETSTTVRAEKARQQLGWAPRFPNVFQGLEDVVARWRAASRQ
ncbi:MAG: NAD(P)-dependent oxidoreductase [Chloroflexi bacterium]|nr:NAD(P)-dependent oxidoreductase [Chloroflexota bacterium]